MTGNQKEPASSIENHFPPFPFSSNSASKQSLQGHDGYRSGEPDPNPSKQYGLKHLIQTNFGDDFVFQIVPKDEWSSMAVSLSTGSVKLHSPVTGQYQRECKGHSGTINQIGFSAPSTPHVLYSCSSDSTLRAWDTRTFRQVSCISTSSNEELFSFSFGGSTDNLLAAITIFFWDWRNMKQVACLEESHVDDVTQVINVGISIGKVGYFGENYRKHLGLGGCEKCPELVSIRLLDIR